MSHKYTEVQGHGLANEGAPFDENGVRASAHHSSVAGRGRAKCACGELSEVLSSSTKRQQWHREHKDEVRKTL
jgi:hypothetical protein